jgi:hypothetical protein
MRMSLHMSDGARIQRATRYLLRLPASAARAVREQADREEFARIDARRARLERGVPDIGHKLMSPQPVGHVPRADPDDPLELLWRLQARRPEGARGR